MPHSVGMNNDVVGGFVSFGLFPQNRCLDDGYGSSNWATMQFYGGASDI